MAIKFLNTVQVDTDVLYVDAANDRVGIGTDNPDTALHVAGSSTLASQSTVLKIENTADQGSSQDIHIYNQYDRDIGIKFETLGGTNYIWQDSNSDDALIISTGGNSRANDAALILEQDQDVIVPNGRLGIGATNPSAKLEVSAGATASVDIAHFSNSNNIAKAKISLSANSSGELSLIDGSNNTDVFITSNGNSYFNSGKVGIGTISPNAMLDIHKNDDTVYDPSADDGQRSIGATIQLNNNSTVTNTFGQIIYDTDSSGQAVARMVFLDAGTSSSAIAFVTEDGNQKGERMRIGSDGAIQFNDYGAGTLVTDASGNISVSSGGGAGGPYLPLSAGLSYPLTDTLYGTKATFGDTNIDVATVTIEGGLAGILDIWRNGTNASYQAIRFRDDTNANTEASIGWASNQLRLNGTSTIVATIGGSEKMRIDSAGDVGIGTTNPLAKLHVSNSSFPQVRINDDANFGESGIRFRSSNAEGVDFHGDIFIDGTGEETGRMGFRVPYNDTEKLTILHNGNVGINNTGPVNGKLVVTSGVDGPLNTIRIQHTRNDANVSTNALEVDMNLSGADTTTGDRTNKGVHVDLDSSANGDASNEHRIHGIGSTVNFTGFSDIVRGGNFYAESNYTGAKTAQLIGVYGQAVHDANSTNGGVSNMYGVYGYSQPQDLGDVDNAFGGYFLVNIGTNRGNADVGVTKGVEGEISIDKSSTINYGTMIGMSSVIDNNEGAVPNFGNQYLFKGDYQGTKGSNAYGIYTEGDKHYFEGKVGIGTTAPSHVLSVQDSVNNADVGISINNSFDDNLATSNPNAVVFLTAASNNGYLRVHGAPANTAAKHQIDLGSTAGSSFLTFSPGGAERMRIATDGNVGIGTTSPDKQLTFAQSTDDAIQIRRYTTTQGNPGEGTGISWTWSSSSTDTETWAAIRTIMPGSGNTHMTFSTKPSGGNVAERLRIQANGDVLINTTSFPSNNFAKLLVAGGAIAVRPAGVNDYFSYIKSNWALEDAFELGIQGAGSQHKLITSGNYYYGSELRLWTNDTQRMTINSAGSVRFNAYNGTNKTGTPSYLLGTDSSGNVVKTNSAPASITSQASSLYDLIPNGTFMTTYAFTSTAGTYSEVMRGNDVITATGTYAVQVVITDHQAGGTQYDEKYSGIMSWHATSTNDSGQGTESEIVLHRAGHAANQGIIYLRTRETTSAEGNELRLEIMCNRTYTQAKNIVFKFVRLI